MNKLILLILNLILAALPLLPAAYSADLQVTRLSQPLCFTENKGQWDEQVSFRAVTGDVTLWFSRDKAVYQFVRRTASTDNEPVNFLNGNHRQLEILPISVNFVGANPGVQVRGDDPLASKSSFFIGNDSRQWHCNVRNWGTVEYSSIYEGIDLRYFGCGRQLEYDFTVSQWADVSLIRIRYNGVRSISVSDSGELVVSTEWGDIVERRPYVYQDINGERVPRECTYRLIDDSTFGFELTGEYAPSYSLVIDPVVMFSSYLGGSLGADEGYDVAIDNSGDIYITGVTYCPDFPTSNFYDQVYGGPSSDAFVTKVAASGSTILWSGFIGGNGIDAGGGIALDDMGNVFIAGHTTSENFPCKNAFDSTYNGAAPGGNGTNDVFVVKISADGDSLVYGTLLGGSEYDEPWEIAVNGLGEAFITGWTYSADFPTFSASDNLFEGGTEAFLLRLSATGNQLVFSTYYGGDGVDIGNGLALGRTGRIYLCGSTRSTNLAVANAYDNSLNEVTCPYDAFLAVFSSDADTLFYATYFGGDCYEHGLGLGVDFAGYAYITGETASGNLPTLNAFDATYNEGTDHYVACFDPSLSGVSSLRFSTFLGGSEQDAPTGIAVDSAGNSYVTGHSRSTNFPTVGQSDGTLAVAPDIVAYKLSPEGNNLIFSSYLGGNGQDIGYGPALDPVGNMFITADVRSSDFPVENAFDVSLGGGHDALILKFGYADADGDGVIDETDNCPLVSNTNQLDANSNSIGDVCECAPSYSVNAGFAGDGFGTSVSTAGDVNSDGSDDFVVGAPSNDELGVNAGRAYVLSGTTGSPLWVLGSSTGNPANEKFGSAVGGGVDINGDFVSDVAIGAPFNSTQASQAGAVSVFSGATGSLVNIEHGIPSASNWLGTSLAVLGLVDNDALGDFAAGAPLKADYGGDGTAYVFRGTTGAGGEILDTINGIISDYLGGSVAATGDIDNDGHADVIIGAYGTSGAVAGRAVVCSIYPIDSVIFQFTGENNGDQFGRSVGGGGDFNNDGTNDFIVGAPFNAGGGFQAGRAYIYSGASGSLLKTLTGIAGENFGWATSFVGDINLDGFDDVAVSSPGRSTNDGLVQIFAGGSGLLLYAFPAPVSDALAGWSIAGQLDCDNDGGPDLIVGAPMTSPAVAGRAYVYLLGDTDNDGLIALKDNCPYAFNPSQVDSDNDSVGDACDECVAIAAEPWQFGNSVSNMWPPSWWQQFNYCYPTSPCQAYCILCRATDFPDWDLFASAIGNEQAYFDPPPGAVSYRPSALAQWEALRGDWTGSCFGFAAGSYLFHDDFLNVGTVFPGHSELGTVPLTADSRKLVNKYYLYQFGYYQQQLINSALKTVTPSQTLAICKEMFSQVTRDDRVLMMFNQSGIGGHAVAPYRCLQDGSNPNLWYLYAHDSNFPADTSKRVAINLGSNTWSYTGQPGWGGSFGLFLLDSVSNYTAPLVMTDTAEATEHIRFYFGEADSVFVESATDTAGFGSEGNFGQIDNGFPITPADGQTRPPIGFFLPTGEYYLSATGVVDGVFTIVDGEKRIFRNGGAKSGIISCYIKANAIAPSITVYASAGKSGRDIYDSSFIEIISITPDSEIVVNISGLGIGGGDSISVTLTQQQDVQIDNFGEQTSYDLSIQIVTPTTESEFYSENIPIDSSTSHLIIPDWRPSGDSVVISVDTSMNNSFDSTIVIPNVESPQFVCGDADGNSIVTISDAVYLINYIFAGGPAPAPLVGGDADCNSIVTISDAVYLINYIFAGGAPPCSACP